ncbi:uncharacterized protein LOC124928991 [Impatiens glandulifera]|uniref:uncharacterized protein LOC124928991 n=1 Tax=Impatiens glandulifera TaxID=253017 RepID=UPI001FB0AA3A|nr:uncharacterized protein LOC124928991 [Impatiens glandulifera]
MIPTSIFNHGCQLQLGNETLYGRQTALALFHANNKSFTMDRLARVSFWNLCLEKPNQSLRKDDICAASILHSVEAVSLLKKLNCLQEYCNFSTIKFRTLNLHNPIASNTIIDMHTTVQPGGRSPKAMNSSQFQPGSNGIQAPASFPSHVKGKKRERSDHGPESIKRERSLKTEEGVRSRVSESNLRSEISKITDKGGLVDIEGVEKLVLLMQPERSDRKLDLNSRSALAAVIAATDRFDCLCQFIQLKGLSVLDEWLQDIHNGKIGDGSPKDGDKHADEFLVVLLCALNKLPVNLQALKMYHIGKSVNNLRTHKNLEIQRKARSLVDTWKKRVEAEMNVNDAKSGSVQATSSPSRSPLPGGPHEIAGRNTVTLATSSKTPVKPLHGELAIKSITTIGLTKETMSPVSGKVSQSRVAFGSNSNVPSRDDRSSSSSQSHNNSQSCSSDHNKTMILCGKEDARSSTVVSISASKNSSSGNREIGSSRNSSLPRNLASEKDVNVDGTSHKAVIKLPNSGHRRSPGQSVSGGSLDDPLIVNGTEVSPLQLESTGQNVKEKTDNPKPVASSGVRAESWESNDLKDILSASDEGDDVSPIAIPDDQCRIAEDASTKFLEVTKVASSTSESDHKAGKVLESSFNSINALIESAKFSEASASPSDGDDAGMNLLASVAADEMLAKSDLVLPDDCLERIALKEKHSSVGDEAKLNSRDGNNDDKHHNHSVEEELTDIRKIDACSRVKETTSDKFEQTPGRLKKEQQLPEQCHRNDERSDELMGNDVSMVSASVSEEAKNPEKVVTTTSTTYRIQNGKMMVRCAADKAIVSKEEPVEGSMPNFDLESDVGKDSVAEGLNIGGHTEQKLSPSLIQAEKECNSDEKLQRLLDNAKITVSDKNTGKTEDTNCSNHMMVAPVPIHEHQVNLGLVDKDKVIQAVVSDKFEECHSTMAVSALTAAKASDSEMKPKFDLNKGFVGEELKYVRPTNSTASRTLLPSVNSVPFCFSPVSSGFPASVTVAAAAKGPFVYPDDLMRTKGEPGWKGSAATSAFRPAEPRKVLDMPVSISETNTGKCQRPMLDFDLNAPGEDILEDITSHESEKTDPLGSTPARSFGGLDLDLNQVDGANETGQYWLKGHNRDFDLNDGPALDESNTEPTLLNHQGRGSMLPQPPPISGNYSSWFPTGNSYSGVTIPSFLPERGEQSFPIIATATPRMIQQGSASSGGTHFTPDVYRGGPVLSSSPFQYPVFPFGTSFPIPSSSFSSFPNIINSQMLGPTAAAQYSQMLGPTAAAQYPRPPYVSILDSNNSIGESNRKWGRQNLDLNAGPGAVEFDSKEDSSSMVARQFSVASCQGLAEEQARMCQQLASNNGVKRKDPPPEGGWDNESFRYNKQASSWQ